MAAFDIRERRLECGDPDVGGFPDPDDLLGVVNYVNRRQRVPGRVLRADALDVLTITRHLRVQLDRREVVAIRTARKHRATYAELAPYMGVRTRQSAEQRYLRLRHAQQVQGGRRSEVQARQGGIEDRPRVEADQPHEQAELLVRIVGRLTELAALVPDDLELELANLRRTTRPSATLAECRLLLRELVDRADLAPALRRVVDDGARLLER